MIYSQQGRGTFVRTDVDPKAINQAAEAGSPEYQAIVAQLDSMSEAITQMDRRLQAFEDQNQKSS